MTLKIKLVLSGSGCLYPIHCGVILRLAEEGYEIEEICGTSGGAIVAVALASGYKPNKEIVKAIKATLPSKNDIIDMSLISLMLHWGLVKGDKIEKMLEKLFVKTLGEAKIPISIVSVNIDTKQCVVFSTKTNPGMSTAKALRASISVPGLFAPYEIDGDKYIDGGMGANYYLDIFGSGENVVGVQIKSKGKVVGKIKKVYEYILALVQCVIELNMTQHIKNANFARTIMVESKFSPLNFKIIDKDVDDMIKEGYDAANLFIKSHPIKSS